MFFLDLFSLEYKFFCPNSAENTMENRAISLVESSRDNSLIACPTSSGTGGKFVVADQKIAGRNKAHCIYIQNKAEN
jgi:hypothetical protein